MTFLTFFSKNALTVVGLSVLGVLTHILPHEFGFTTVGAISMLAAALLPRRLMLLPVLVTVAVVDAVQGTYGLLAMSIVYLGHGLSALSISNRLVKVKVSTVVVAGLLSAVVFYLVSNLLPMVLGFYANTPDGWIACYTNALPFLLRGIAANIVFGGIAFSLFWLAKETYAHRFTVAKRY